MRSSGEEEYETNVTVGGGGGRYRPFGRPQVGYKTFIQFLEHFLFLGGRP